MPDPEDINILELKFNTGRALKKLLVIVSTDNLPSLLTEYTNVDS